MTKTRPEAPLRRHLWLHVLGAAVLAACSSTSTVEASTGPSASITPEPVIVLAERLAREQPATSSIDKQGLVKLYEAAYGPIAATPTAWAGALRQTLTCDAIGDVSCLRASLEALEARGGIDTRPLGTLPEVARFEASPESIRSRVAMAREKVETGLGTSSLGAPVSPNGPIHLIASERSSNLVPPLALAAPARPQQTGDLTWWAAIAFIVGGAGIAYGVASHAERNRASRQSVEREAKEREARDLDLKAELEAREKAQRDQMEVFAATAERVAAAVKAPIHSVAAANESIEEPVNHAQAVDARHADPRLMSARRLLDALHRAERDVDPFLGQLGNLGTEDPKNEARRKIVVSWHGAILKARNDLSEAFSNQGWDQHLPVTPAPKSLAEAMQRLMDHAALFTMLLQAQNKEAAAVFHWSKQLPGAVLHLYWSSQTQRAASELKANPMPSISYAPVPSLDVPKAPAARAHEAKAPVQAQARSTDFYTQALRHATTSGGRRAG